MTFVIGRGAMRRINYLCTRRPTEHGAGDRIMRDADSVGGSVPAQSGSRATYFAMLGWLIWLFYLVPVIVFLLATHPAPLRLIASLLGAAVFVAIYVWTVWQGARRVVGIAPPFSSQTRLWLWLPILALLALSIILAGANGVTWGALFIY